MPLILFFILAFFSPDTYVSSPVSIEARPEKIYIERSDAGQYVNFDMLGEVIGAMGASGSSLFPHLHYELRDGSGSKIVNGLPSYFSNFRRLLGSKEVKVKRGYVGTGEIVESQ